MEDPEDASKNTSQDSDGDFPVGVSSRRQLEHHRSHEPETKANVGKGRSRKNRSQANKPSKSKAKNMAVKRAPAGSPRDFDTNVRGRHRQNISTRSASPSSGSEAEEENPAEDHRTALARARLTSPSMLSSITTLTTVTNKSSSSSGSNSTVTQSSLSRRSNLGKRVEVEEAPLSPAAPDPPAIFTFMDDDPPLQQEPDSDEEEEAVQDEARHQDIHFPEGTAWPEPRALMETAYEEQAVTQNNPDQGGASSSASSSFHGEDSFSEHPADHETDRSTSPEASDHGKDSSLAAPLPPAASDDRSVKIASQIAAARHRQNSWGSMPQSESPEVPRGNIQRSHVHSSVASARIQHQISQHPPPPRVENPVTGYELLATKLSASGFDIDGGPRIKPMYRKFEALNHRLLLHLQDELSELEDQLQRIDIADTQSRSFDRHIVPASRRAAAQAGGELEWHKTDILGRIGFKLNQYNQALASFNSIQSLSSPHPAEVEDYREYLYAEQPITESETQFLDPEEDLVSISRHEKRRRHHHRTNSFESGSITSSVLSHSAISSRASVMHTRPMTHPNNTPLPSATPHVTEIPEVAVPRRPLPTLACSVAIVVLLPILSFIIIPAMLGRVIVTISVPLSAIGGLLYVHLLDSNVVLSQEGAVCAALYGGVMLVIAAVMV